MLIEKKYSPIFQRQRQNFLQCRVCVSYHKAREVGSGEALQGEGIHEMKWSWEVRGVAGRNWERGLRRPRKKI
mgnify:CR=1 FL=1